MQPQSWISRLVTIANTPIPRVGRLGGALKWIGLFFLYLVFLGVVTYLYALYILDMFPYYADPVSVILFGSLLLPSVYITALLLWLKFSKQKTLRKLAYDAIPLILVNLVMYFWFNASRQEYYLSDYWDNDLVVSNLAAMLGYVKALLQTVAAGIIAFMLSQRLKNNT